MTANRKTFRLLQERIEAVCSLVMPTVVAVEEAGAILPASKSGDPSVSQRFASGVIITAGGLILTQSHVSHQLAWRPGEVLRSRLPGERATIITSDGRRTEAELLGADLTFDLALLRLVERRTYPHVNVDPTIKAGLGEYVLKFGHPRGFSPGRPPVVRFGRVLYEGSDIFVTDCLITGGDSGGPFFDLDGRLLGIVHMNDVPKKLRTALASPTPRFSGAGLFSGTTSAYIHQLLPGMIRCELAALDQDRYQRFIRPHRRADGAELLPQEQWTQGLGATIAFREIVRDSQNSVVSILDKTGHQVSHGTIVESDGWIVTVASTLSTEPTCQLADGRVAAARVVGVDPSFGIALLKVPLVDLSSARWSEELPVAGMILTAVGMAEVPLAVGIVSVAQRSRRRARQPVLLGCSTKHGYLVTGLGDEARIAGIRPDEVIQTIAGRFITNDQDLANIRQEHLEGERVPVRLLRNGCPRELILQFTAGRRTEALLPTLFEHDMPLTPVECGSPAVDLDGLVIGITMNRGMYGCKAVSGDWVRRLLPVLKSMRPG